MVVRSSAFVFGAGNRLFGRIVAKALRTSTLVASLELFGPALRPTLGGSRFVLSVSLKAFPTESSDER
jgi:hypothetical protein